VSVSYLHTFTCHYIDITGRFHPEFHDSHSQVQREMMRYMQTWLDSHGHRQHGIIQRLSRDSVRNHRNIRATGDDSGQSYVGGAGHDAGVQAQASLQGYMHNIPGVQQASSLMNTFGVASQNDGRREAITRSSSPGEGYRAQPSVTYAAPPVPLGEASVFYGSVSEHQRDATQSFQSTEYGADSHYHHHHSSSHERPRHDNAPSFPDASPLAFPSVNPSFASDSTQFGGTHAPYFPSPDLGPSYSPSYAPPNVPPPTFPSGPSLPGGPSYGEQHPPPNQYNNYGGGPPTGW
jgi:Heterokaryon incompatibility protein Het-C